MNLLVVLVFLSQAAGLVGSWHGTSLCVDREHYPNCHDEEVIFDAVARGTAGDTVTVRADKIVQGHREFMVESDYVRGANGLWVGEFHNERVQLRLTLRVSGDTLIGQIIDVPNKRIIRDQKLTRVH